MKKALLQSLVIPLAALALLTSRARADEFNFTSYYPAPVGNYSFIKLEPQPAITPDTDCDIGTLYANADNNSLPYFCTPVSVPPPSSQYLKLPGVWTLYNDPGLGPRVYISDSPANKKVGIGTTTPIFKLTLDDDGGILADNSVDSYNFLPLSYINGAGTRLLFYPTKTAFRAGYAAGDEWDDGNIGGHSIAMGYGNRATRDYSVILGGQNNSLLTKNNSFIGGGLNNTSTGRGSNILGGENNTITAPPATALDYQHTVSGYNNSISCSAAGCVVLGGRNNVINSTQRGMTIAGGDGNQIIGSINSYIGGGLSNSINGGGQQTILGGRQNTTNASNTIIVGGYLNNAGGGFGVIAGGYNNSSNASGGYSTILGGSTNVANNSGATVSGGQSNSATGSNSTVSGGQSNIASGTGATVLNGNLNSASGAYSIILNGYWNNNAGDYSLVIGRASALNASADRTFLWNYNPGQIQTTIGTPDAFIINTGRVGIRDTAPAALLEINANASADGYLALTSTSAATAGDKFIIKNDGRIGVGGITTIDAGKLVQFGNGAYIGSDGKFYDNSSRKYKENITDLDLKTANMTLRGLDPVRFNYKNEKGEEYLGFIAEDVPGLVVQKSREGLVPMDIAAVLTKVIQEQDKILNEQRKTSEMLMKEVAELKNKIKNRKSLNSHE